MEHFFPPNSGEDQKKVFIKNGTRRVARNSQMGGGQIRNGGGAKRAELPAIENFGFFLQKWLNFKAILIKNNVFEM